MFILEILFGSRYHHIYRWLFASHLGSVDIVGPLKKYILVHGFALISENSEKVWLCESFFKMVQANVFTFFLAPRGNALSRVEVD